LGKEEFHWVCGVMQGWFSAKLGSTQPLAKFLWPPTATGTSQAGINHFYSSIWIQQTALYGQGRVLLGLWCHIGLVFQQNLGQKLVTDPISCQRNFCGHQQHQGHDKQESTTFILPYGSNKQHCMDKEESYWVCGVVQGWFSAKLGSKISGDKSQLSAQFL
jgi:hypothetical protein